jgi:nitroreductase
MMTRRRLFAVTAGALVAVGGGTSAFLLTREPHAARAPWDPAAADTRDDARLRALALAILAPNPHNRQPWLFELVGEHTIAVFCDLDRRLPETDPFDRQITIGFGCFLELLAMAAAADGHLAEIMLFPDGEPQPRLDGRPLAVVTFARAGATQPDPLFAHLHDRRSNKEPFDTTRTVPAEALATLVAAAPDLTSATAAPELVQALRALTFRAFELEAATPRTHLESIRLLRIGKAEIEASPDGIDIGGAVPELLAAAGLLTREAAADPASEAFAQTTEMYRDIMHTGMAYVWLVTAGNTRADQIAAGRAWARVNLAASATGLSAHPVSQALQEYPEMQEEARALPILLGVPGNPARVQMLARIGYGPVVPPSPRWPLETRIRPA